MCDYLNTECMSKESEIEVVYVIGIENYKEYYPLTTIPDSREFMLKVLQMMKEPLTEDGVKVYEFLKGLKRDITKETGVDIAIKLYKSLTAYECYTCVIDILDYKDLVFEGVIRSYAKSKINEAKSQFGEAILSLEIY